MKNYTDALIENQNETENSSELNQPSDFEVVDIEMELYSSILSESIEFSLLSRFFECLNRGDFSAIYDKLKKFLDEKIKTTNSYFKNLVWYKKLQYSYNAYITEKFLHTNFNWEYAPDEGSHLYLTSDWGPNGEDFKNIKFTSYLNDVKFKDVDINIELKNFGNLSSRNKSWKAINPPGAKFVLSYIMSTGSWIISDNNKETEYKIELGPITDGLINLTWDEATQKLIKKPWEIQSNKNN